MRTYARIATAILATAALAAGCGPGSGAAPPSGDLSRETVLRVVPMADLTILDPVVSTTYITRDHAYLVYDTLFGMDAQGQIAPQMVDTWKVSGDRLTWTFMLRDGLEFHDGAPVTTDDVIASLERWGQRDTLGQRLLSFREQWKAIDAKTFQLKLSAPFGLVLESLGKPTSLPPFIMPKRVAQTPASEQIRDPIGSGPFVFVQDEWRPGERAVYIRNPKYKPRPEPASGTAGGKIARVDRIEWRIIKDPQTQANALAAGEVDLITAPAYEQYAGFRNNPDVRVLEDAPDVNLFLLFFNHQEPPFDNVKARRAAIAALNQPAFLRTQVGIPGMYRVCFSVYPCDTPYSTEAGMDLLAKPDVERARQLLKESGYNRETVVVLQATDLAHVRKLPEVAAQLLRSAGFNVDVQPMDWGAVQARRAKQRGWNILPTFGNIAAFSNPLGSLMFSGAGYPRAFWGWPSDAKLESLRDAFALAGTEPERKALAEQIQIRILDIASFVPLGEYRVLPAARKNVTGFVPGFFTVFWNLEKE
jgi:peptide/nickel transport system substrate-binding protein